MDPAALTNAMDEWLLFLVNFLDFECINVWTSTIATRRLLNFEETFILALKRNQQIVYAHLGLQFFDPVALLQSL